MATIYILFGFFERLAAFVGTYIMTVVLQNLFLFYETCLYDTCIKIFRRIEILKIHSSMSKNV